MFRNFNTFIYDNFFIDYQNDKLIIKFNYEIQDLEKFTHTLEIPTSNKDINKSFVENIVFNIGIMEAINYYKATLAKNFTINCGTINQEQQDFFKKLYFNGLGEFFYRNNLNPEYETFLNFQSTGKTMNSSYNYEGNGNLIAVGGGKDSCVTLSLLKNDNNTAIMVNPKDVMIECANIAGYKNHLYIKRILDMDKIKELNNQGFLNGHIPFSASIAFIMYLGAYLNNKKNIILSNEVSANEANVIGTKINHQYSKSFEFETDFRNYAQKYLGGSINYYSFLRPILEYQIGMIFAKNTEFHKIFKSCNVGSKSTPWKWCSKCSKCLFVYSLLSPWLYKEKLIDIFGNDLFNDESLLNTFLELLGKSNVKPFDCVGTFEEINYAITKTIKNLKNSKLPFLLKYYKDNFYDEKILEKDLEHYWNDENNLNEFDIKILKEALK